MTETVVRTEGLRKSYGATRALRGVDLEIGAGGVVGIVGPNGAGKTTLVEILEGLREPSAGRVEVLGLDPRRDTGRLRERIGVQLQSTSLPDRLTVLETLRLFAAFYPRPRPLEEVLEQVGLVGLEDRSTSALSGGERQRLVLGMALVHDPELVLLDEPTAGLDPEARRALHDDLEALRKAGRTVLMTTHYIEEVEKLCDRMIVVRNGEVVADGAPFELVRRAGGRTTVWIAVEGELDRSRLSDAGLEPAGERGEYLRFTASDPVAALDALRPLLRDGGLTVRDLRLAQPTLEDVYLELVGAEEPPGPGGAG